MPRLDIGNRGTRPRSSVIMTIYNPFSVNLTATEPGSGGEAEGNCVAVRRGGEQPDASKQSQTKVNSIQPEYAASLLGNGEACARRNLIRCHLPSIGEVRACSGGWSENVCKDVYVGGESCMDRQRPQGRAVQQSEPPYELRSLVMRMELREAGK